MNTVATPGAEAPSRAAPPGWRGRLAASPLRLRVFLAHLSISATIIALCVALILFVWYPGPWARFEDVYRVLLVMVLVDVGAGPLCSLVAASPGKAPRELARDLAIIGLVQLTALGYALYTTGTARPVYIVYSFGQFDVEHANQVPREELALAEQTSFAGLPWFGPRYVLAELPANREEANRVLQSSMKGGPFLKDMPRYFAAWPGSDPKVLARARPVPDLWDKGELKPAVRALLSARGIAEEDAVVVPLFGQTRRGTVIVGRSDRAILGIVPDLAP